MALDICRQKQRTGQSLKNAAGLVVKIVKDPAARRRFLDDHMEAAAKERYRQRERAILRQNQEVEERALILEYEQFRQTTALGLFEQLSDSSKQALSKEKSDLLRREGRLEKMAPDVREREVTDLILQDLARNDVPPYSKWLLRKRAGQAVLPFAPIDNIA
jgi:hypothetical protein